VTKRSATSTKKKTTSTKKEADHYYEFVSIAKSVGTASVIMVALIVVTTPGSIWVAGPVVGAMCIFGVAMGYFASK
jgi:hypothetical protein